MISENAALSGYQVDPRVGSIEALIEKYLAFDPAGLRVDLGCGYYKPQGFIGIDNLVGADSQVENQDNLPDILMDLDYHAVPLPDQSCIEIHTSHYLEHSNMPHIFNEVFRLLKPGGLFVNTVPYANSAEGMSPGHNIFLTEKWFQKNIQFQTLFFIEQYEYFESEDYMELPQEMRDLLPFAVARKFLFNVCHQMKLICRTRRGLEDGGVSGLPAGEARTINHAQSEALSSTAVVSKGNRISEPRQ